MSTSSWRANSRHVSPNHPVDYRHITRWTIAKYPCKLSPNHPVDGPSAVPRRRYGCQTRSCATCPASLTPNCRTACRERGLSSSKDQEHAARPRRPAGLPRAKRCWTPTGTHAGWWTRDPSAALAGAIPRLFDEWQVAPSIWNHVRRAVDDRSEPGQFILTGSAVPADDVTRHTGAGRFSRLRMRPMSLFELGISSGDSSLGRTA